MADAHLKLLLNLMAVVSALIVLRAGVLVIRVVTIILMRHHELLHFFLRLLGISIVLLALIKLP